MSSQRSGALPGGGIPHPYEANGRVVVAGSGEDVGPRRVPGEERKGKGGGRPSLRGHTPVHGVGVQQCGSALSSGCVPDPDRHVAALDFLVVAPGGKDVGESRMPGDDVHGVGVQQCDAGTGLVVHCFHHPIALQLFVRARNEVSFVRLTADDNNVDCVAASVM